MEREDAVEIGVAVGGVAVFILALVVVGLLYGNGDTIGADGGLPLVGAVAVFIIAMGIGGFWLAERGDD
jgi:hypothetical protein